MRLFLLTLLFAFLPASSQTDDNTVKIVGNSVIFTGETTVLTALPYNPSYTYVWSINDEEKVGRYFHFSISDNTITVTHLGLTPTALVEVFCSVYSDTGSLIGTAGEQIVVDNQHH